MLTKCLTKGFTPLYGDIGSVYESRDTTEVEDVLVTSLHTLVNGPKRVADGLPVKSLGGRVQPVLLEVCDQAGIIGQTPSVGGRSPLLYSPQYWNENPERFAQIAASFGDERTRRLVQRIRDSQGLYVPQGSDAGEAELLRTLAHEGVLPAPVVGGLKGRRAFAFTPFSSAAISDRAIASRILEKTRAILASVRYGQQFGTYSIITDPAVLLNALKSRHQIGPHSEIPQQYALLINQGVGRVSRSTISPGKYLLHFIQTQENEIALKAAIDILQAGVPMAATHVDRGLHEYAINGTYAEAPTARARRQYAPTTESFRDLHALITDVLVTRP